MIETVFTLSNHTDRTVEKVIQDDNLDYIHMLFNKDEGLPLHYSNSNVYMTVLRGNLSIALDDQGVHVYPGGTLLKIPYKTKVNVQNMHDEMLELLAIKAPAPKNYPKE
ncbi:MAG: cupin domain-containing protein [Brevefilum sp.]|nr:cupin domain-containing protein [Brevefilum sp.]MDW7755974.1 cupin domain-containing protein [Brevefilum sp.]